MPKGEHISLSDEGAIVALQQERSHTGPLPNNFVTPLFIFAMPRGSNFLLLAISERKEIEERAW